MDCIVWQCSRGIGLVWLKAVANIAQERRPPPFKHGSASRGTGGDSERKKVGGGDGLAVERPGWIEGVAPVLFGDAEVVEHHLRPKPAGSYRDCSCSIRCELMPL